MKGSHMVKSKKNTKSLHPTVMLLCWFFIFSISCYAVMLIFHLYSWDDSALLFHFRRNGRYCSVRHGRYVHYQSTRDERWCIPMVYLLVFPFLLVLLHSLLKSYMIFTFLNVSCIHFSGFVFVRNILRYFTYLFIHELKQLHEYVFSSNIWRNISF